MKKTFKQFLIEYKIKPFGGPVSIHELENFLEFEQQDELKIKNSKLDDNLQIIRCKLSNTYLCIVLKIKNEIIGYAMMNIFEETKYWKITSIVIYSNDNKGKGYGSLLYSTLVESNYVLLNGSTLSNDAERIWKKLIHKYNSGTFDKIENKIYQLDDRPTNDKANSDSLRTDQRYFWIISKDKLNYDN